MKQKLKQLLSSEPARQSIARVCLCFCIVLFFLGMLLLCDCPGWYVVCVLLAGIARRLTNPKTRFWANFWLVASMVMLILHVSGGM